MWMHFNAEPDQQPKFGICFAAMSGTSKKMTEEFELYKEQFKNIVVVTQANAWFDEEAMLKCVPHMLEGTRVYLKGGESTLLFCDNWAPNKTKEIRGLMSANGYKLQATPENLTHVRLTLHCIE